MSYVPVAQKMAYERNRAKELPKRFKKTASISSLYTSLKIAMTGAFVMYGGIFIYLLLTHLNDSLLTNPGQGLKVVSAAIIYGAIGAGLTFTLLFPLPTLLSLALPHYREKANDILLNPRYFFVHACMAVWVTLLLSGGLILLNNSLSTPFNSDLHSLLDLSNQQLVSMFAIVLIFYEVVIIYHRWDMNRQQLAASQHTQNTHFKLLMGRSTGTLAERHHGAGILKDQTITLTLEDAAKNILILGGTGGGKTLQAINPLLLQLLQQDCGGLIFDVKGDFHSTVDNFANGLGRFDRIVRIGIGGQPINLIEGLSPEMAASFLNSCLLLGAQQHSKSDFWSNSSYQLCSNVLGLLHFLPKRYNLVTVYDYIFNKTVREELSQELETLRATLDAQQIRKLDSYMDYMTHVFDASNEKTISDVKATVALVLAPFKQPELHDAFCMTSQLQMEQVLEGTVFLLSLPLSNWGTCGKAIYNFIKLRFFNVMQKRNTMPDWNKDRPVFFLCDEYQNLITGSGNHSDLNFWDKSRSSKTIGIISAQSISSFYAAMGDRDVANAVLQNFRQKICFMTEDEETISMLQKLSGGVEIEKRTVSKQSGSSTNFSSKSNTNRSKSETITQVEKDVVDAQLIRNLQGHQAFAFLSIQKLACDDIIDMQVVT